MLQTVIYGVLVVGGSCLLALAGFELVHRNSRPLYTIYRMY